MTKTDASARRALCPATSSAFVLPTVASLLMLAAVGCSSPSNGGDVSADLPHRTPIATIATNGTMKTAPTGAPTTTSSAGGTSIGEPIDPNPMPLPGEAAIVVPPPKPPTKPPKIVPPPKPHKLGGVKAITTTDTI